jgi:hypothetical protein
MNTTNNNLYYVVFPDESANFYEEVNQGYLKPLLESKIIDSNKVMEKCSLSFSNGNIDCDTLLIINGKPEKIKVKKIFPSNLTGQQQFFNMLEEHQNYGGFISKKYKKKSRKHRKTKKPRKCRKSKKSRKHHRK